MKWLREYFHLTQGEQRGVQVWVVLMLLILITPRIYKNIVTPPIGYADETYESYLSKLTALEEAAEGFNDYEVRSKTVVSEQQEFIPDEKKATVVEKESNEQIKNSKAESRWEKKLVDINSSDTTELKKIYGIGSVLSQRIIKYKDLLGGFHQKEQLKEVYGIDEERYNKISSSIFVSSIELTGIAINEGDFKVLVRHPYLTAKQVGVILNFRKQHGKISNLEELRSTKVFSEEDLNRLKPYLIFNDES